MSYLRAYMQFFIYYMQPLIVPRHTAKVSIQIKHRKNSRTIQKRYFPNTKNQILPGLLSNFESKFVVTSITRKFLITFSLQKELSQKREHAELQTGIGRFS